MTSPLGSPRRRDEEESPYTLHVSVIGASRDLNGDVQISAMTNIPTYGRTKYNITRSHAELERLSGHIQSRYPEYISPIPPSKTLEVTLYVKAVEVFLQRIASNRTLRESDGVRLFFDSEFQYTPPVVQAPKQKSVFNLFGSVATKAPEIDPFFDHAKNEAAGIETNMSTVAKTVEKAGKAEKAYASACLDVCARLVTVADEEPEPISSNLKKLSKHFQLMESGYSSQAAYSLAIFNQYCDYHARSAQAATYSLNNRANALVDYDAACKATAKKLQTIEKLKASSSIRQDKVELALEELSEAKHNESVSRELVKKLGENVKYEYQLYSKRHQEDLTQQLDEYVARQLHYNSQILAVLSDRI
ncbi:Vacuolar protein sorting-associated protein 17 [Phlyctochytrium planicorne]|nr:Vacuolar protein sorting-associated protein 17 [Phlyctochytrium planicorne]